MPRKKSGSAPGRFFYALRYRAGEYALRAFVEGSPYVPYRWLMLFAHFAARATFWLLWRYRKRMEENVAEVFAGEIPAAGARKALVWRAWLNFTRGVLDTTAVMHFSKEQILSVVRLEGEEHIQQALENGKGVLALSAHLGSFTMIGARLGASGYPFSAVVKQPADARFTKLVDGYRSQLGIHTISAKPRREAVRGILRALRDNHIVLIIADEFKSGNVMVDFFGMKAPAPRGPATLALRTGAVTLPMFATRNAAGQLILKVGAPIAPILGDDLEASVVATTELYTRHIEAAIRQFPDQWNWLGLPRRDGKPSRTELARQRKEARAKNTAQAAQSDRVGTGASSL